MCPSSSLPASEPRKRTTAFRYELATLLNRVSAENGSNTPDFILAAYLLECREAFDRAVLARERWYGHQNSIMGEESA